MTPDTGRPERRTLRRLGVAVPALAITGALAAGGIAWAQDTPTPDTSATAPSQSTAPGDGMQWGPGHGRMGGPGHGMGNRLHGEFTVQDQDGEGTQTVLTQYGEATAVSNTSITVKSSDGYEQTYKIDENTLVSANRDGIESIKKGDEVRVVATGSADDATAIRVVDATLHEQLRERSGMGFGPRGFGGQSS